MALLAGFTLPKSIAVRSLFSRYEFLDQFSWYATRMAGAPLRIDKCSMLAQYVDEEREETRGHHFGCTVFPTYVNTVHAPEVVMVFVDTDDGSTGYVHSILVPPAGNYFAGYSITPVSRFAHLDRFAAQVALAIDRHLS